MLLINNCYIFAVHYLAVLYEYIDFPVMLNDMFTGFEMSIPFVS